MTRRLTRADAEALWAATRAAHGGVPTVGESSCMQDLADPDHVGLCIDGDAGELLAYARACRIAGVWHVLDVGVHPTAQQRGLGGQVVSMLLGELARLGDADGTTLEVREGNLPAIRLYERAGFRLHGCRTGYYGDGVHALVMWRAPAALIAAGTDAAWEPEL